MPILHFVQDGEKEFGKFLSGIPCEKREFNNGGEFAEVCYSANIDGTVLVIEPEGVIVESQTVYAENWDEDDTVLYHFVLKDDTSPYRQARGATYEAALAAYSAV